MSYLEPAIMKALNEYGDVVFRIGMEEDSEKLRELEARERVLYDRVRKIFEIHFPPRRVDMEGNREAFR